jgi:formylglycine-generating enzyme required for sulfatase activity
VAGEAVFIGYRRDDTADVAGRIYDALEARFGRERVFKDVDNIPVGANFGDYIKTILPRCRVALILMGPHWIRAEDGTGRRRLEDANDWVRIEVETALATPGLQVVPVLVNGAHMPRADELPASLEPLLHLNAAVIRRDPDFRHDIDRLGTALRASVRTGLLDLGAVGGGRKQAQRLDVRALAPTSSRQETKASPATVTKMAPLWIGIGGLAALASAALFLWGPVSQFFSSAPDAAAPIETTAARQSSAASSVDLGGSPFRDCEALCPEMVVVRGGAFTIGSNAPGRDADERPEHAITIMRFAVAKYETTFAEWDACANAGACRTVSDGGWGRGTRPVINVSWDDAQTYVRWLSQQTGKTYRLLSEAEWEYAASGNTRTQYWWGDANPSCDTTVRNGANFDPCNHRTMPVGSYSANPFGLYDVHGNVWEWVQDCYDLPYANAPRDGSALESPNCERRSIRGGNWYFSGRDMQTTNRWMQLAQIGSNEVGFRVARSL